MRISEFLISGLVGFLLTITGALAASSDWHDLGGGKGRLVASLDPQSNIVSGVVEVSLKPGWSTYWRYPGSTGIPPNFDFAGSVGMKLESVLFGAPQLMQSGGARYAGYKGTVLFPFKGTIDNPANARISLDLLIGVCEEICIPAKAKMKINGSDLLLSDPNATMLVTKASLSVPSEQDAEDLNVKTEMLDPSTLQISVNFQTSEKQPGLFVEGPDDWYLTPARHISGNGDRHVFNLDVSDIPEGENVLETRLRYTLSAGSRGIEFEY